MKRKQREAKKGMEPGAEPESSSTRTDTMEVASLSVDDFIAFNSKSKEFAHRIADSQLFQTRYSSELQTWSEKSDHFIETLESAFASKGKSGDLALFCLTVAPVVRGDATALQPLTQVIHAICLDVGHSLEGVEQMHLPMASLHLIQSIIMERAHSVKQVLAGFMIRNQINCPSESERETTLNELVRPFKELWLEWNDRTRKEPRARMLENYPGLKAAERVFAKFDAATDRLDLRNDLPSVTRAFVDTYAGLCEFHWATNSFDKAERLLRVVLQVLSNEFQTLLWDQKIPPSEVQKLMNELREKLLGLLHDGKTNAISRQRRSTAGATSLDLADNLNELKRQYSAMDDQEKADAILRGEGELMVLALGWLPNIATTHYIEDAFRAAFTRAATNQEKIDIIRRFELYYSALRTESEWYQEVAHLLVPLAHFAERERITENPRGADAHQRVGRPADKKTLLRRELLRKYIHRKADFNDIKKVRPLFLEFIRSGVPVPGQKGRPGTPLTWDGLLSNYDRNHRVILILKRDLHPREKASKGLNQK